MKLILIEDDVALCEFLEQILLADGYAVTVCQNPLAGLAMLEEQSFDALILDRMLPGMDGLELLKRIRRKGYTLPVLMLTALGAAADKVEGLDAGADDYLAKPFDAAELKARLRALLRSRSGGYSTALRFADASLDMESRVLTGPQGSCELSGRESALMAFFFQNSGQILPRTLILERIWGADSEVEEGNLNNYIFFVRRRLRQVGSGVQIKTVRGLGYRAEEC